MQPKIILFLRKEVREVSHISTMFIHRVL